ncbi:glycosyltransferase [Verrucomicrobiaceae bacterium 5K15]|uniref:Glycosyltransferase n=1 Tax=Oceaniferula flava TaxID=2800421 RepID=A0AAE2SF93_9BACT|nr:glycosyltransferase family 4 protein [Oceaniferula flavus]MBK1856282.1 glycosyltransferase [Oceaniferula flavus]MBM1137589.1 glycosyltransferase [Oceaniferula flavus]
MPAVLLHSPYPRQRSQGNAVTAKRMTELLRDGGLDVAIHERGDAPISAGCLIALNARKSAGEIFAFHQRQPKSPIVTLLTGTDVNHPEMEDAESDTRKALAVSTAIVSLHEGFSHRIPEDLTAKTQVIYPSVRLPDTMEHRPKGQLEVIIAGNFRAEKNPALMMEAVRGLQSSPMQFHAFGQGGEYQSALEQTAAECPNFHFHGVQDHDVVIEKMKTAHVLLNTSTEEGGANAICEAVVIGLPVIASKIAGNIGMLGSDYDGLFPLEDPAVLIEILARTANDSDFYQHLKQQISTRAPLFSYHQEKQAWCELVRRLTVGR